MRKSPLCPAQGRFSVGVPVSASLRAEARREAEAHAAGWHHCRRRWNPSAMPSAWSPSPFRGGLGNDSLRKPPLKGEGDHCDSNGGEVPRSGRGGPLRQQWWRGLAKRERGGCKEGTRRPPPCKYSLYKMVPRGGRYIHTTSPSAASGELRSAPQRGTAETDHSASLRVLNRNTPTAKAPSATA